MSSSSAEEGITTRRVIDVAGYEVELGTLEELLHRLIHIGQRCEPHRVPEVIEALDAVCQRLFGKQLLCVYFPQSRGTEDV